MLGQLLQPTSLSDDDDSSSAARLSALSDNTDRGLLAGMMAPAPASPPSTTAVRPYIAKRPHKKSRAGCYSCKARKVKCSETRPQCRACLLRKEACVYPAAARGARPSARSSASASASASASTGSSTMSSSAGASPVSSASGDSVVVRCHDRAGHRPLGFARAGQAGAQRSSPAEAWAGLLLSEPLFAPPDIDETDMRLLWFYTAKGFDAFTADAGRQPDVTEALRVVVPRHALASRFLMDCLLALSALQLQMLRQPIEPERVLVYRARAFAGYRAAVEHAHARPHTYPALLACSLLLCALASQTFRDPDAPPLYLLDWIVVWRGIGLVMRLIRPRALFASGLALLFARPPIPDLDAAAACVPNHLLFLVSTLSSAGCPADQPVYYATLKYLGSLYRELRAGTRRMLALRTVTWFTFVPARFVDLARARRPHALLILAHYLVFAKLCRRVWWMQGIADKEIRAIHAALDPVWHPYMAGPLQALQATAAADDDDDDDAHDVAVAQILLQNTVWGPDTFLPDEAAAADSAAAAAADKAPRRMHLSLVDNAGHAILFNGTWVRVDNGETAIFDDDVADGARV